MAFYTQIIPRPPREVAHPPSPMARFYHIRVKGDPGETEDCLNPVYNTLHNIAASDKVVPVEPVRIPKRFERIPTMQTNFGVRLLPGFGLPSAAANRFTRDCPFSCASFRDQFCDRSLYGKCSERALPLGTEEWADVCNRSVSTYNHDFTLYQHGMINTEKCRPNTSGFDPYKKVYMQDLGPKYPPRVAVCESLQIEDKIRPPATRCQKSQYCRGPLPEHARNNHGYFSPEFRGFHYEDTTYQSDYEDPHYVWLGRTAPKHRLTWRDTGDLREGHIDPYMKFKENHDHMPYWGSDEYYLNRLKDICKPTDAPIVWKTQPSKICNSLYWGSADHALDTVSLRKEGITHVLNCSGFGGCNPYPAESGVVGYKSLPAVNGLREDVTKYHNDAVKFIDDARRSGGKVLVFSSDGFNRGCFIMASYLMSREGYTMEKALEDMKTARGGFMSNTEYQIQLMQLSRNYLHCPKCKYLQ